MPTDEQVALARRVKEARLQTAVRLGRHVSQAEMATLVSKKLGTTLHQTQWSRYENADSEPSLTVLRAMSWVSGLTESYIAFGAPGRELLTADEEQNQGIPRSRQPGRSDPLIDPTRDRKLSPEEEERALRIAADDRRTHEGKRPVKGRKRAGGR